MPVGTTTVWNDILSELKLNHRELVRHWFEDLSLVAFDGGVIRVRTRNPAQLRYLEQHGQSAFAQAAQASTGRLVTALFDLDDKNAEPTQNNNLKKPGPGGLLAASFNPAYTFDNFITGPCNRMAHAVAWAVAEGSGQDYNPLFIHGGPGVGKTHLLQAIGQKYIDRHPDAQCHHLACETFVNNFMQAVERGEPDTFRATYLQTDLLIVDDIHFLSGRERSQEEFFHTFNVLLGAGRHIILASNQAPPEIPHLEERLINRFQSGLVALLESPCLETRLAIVNAKAKMHCIELPENVAQMIAASVEDDVKGLEKALLRIEALSQSRALPIRESLAREALSPPTSRPIKVSAIAQATAQRFDIAVEDLCGKSRIKSVLFPRQVGLYLARLLTSRSLEEIGEVFGGRDHSTVSQATRVISAQADEDHELSLLLDEITKNVKNASI